jgi:hypothetical protein
VTAGILVRPYDSPAPSDRETHGIVAAGVDAFLNGYSAGQRPRSVGNHA